MHLRLEYRCKRFRNWRWSHSWLVSGAPTECASGFPSCSVTPSSCLQSRRHEALEGAVACSVRSPFIGLSSAGRPAVPWATPALTNAFATSSRSPGSDALPTRRTTSAISSAGRPAVPWATAWRAAARLPTPAAGAGQFGPRRPGDDARRKSRHDANAVRPRRHYLEAPVNLNYFGLFEGICPTRMASPAVANVHRLARWPRQIHGLQQSA